ncbi:MFS amino acid permease [Chiua virens]|nr:MFS amino acid permease [Chiua virens]
MATTTQNDSPIDKAQPGASWKDKEEHVLPKNRLGIVFFGLMCSFFLAALDQTIVATALPTIVAKLGGGNNYSWIGSAYMLSASAFDPLYGKLSNMFGRKPILYSSILIFLFGSAMCGAAQNMTWLIVCRAVQGIGGGGIIQLVVITISDIVPLKECVQVDWISKTLILLIMSRSRGRYAGLVGTTYGIARLGLSYLNVSPRSIGYFHSVVGPLLGGVSFLSFRSCYFSHAFHKVFAENVSWRWCFFINLYARHSSSPLLFRALTTALSRPTGGVAAVVLLIFLNLNPHQRRPIRDQLAEVDFIGLFCFVIGVVCLLLGFNFSGTSWSDAETIAPLVIGIVLLIAGGFNEMYTKRSAIIPARLFKTRTTGIILVTTFFHAIVFFLTAYASLQVVMFSSRLTSYTRMFTFSLGISFVSIVSGLILHKTGKYRPIIWAAYALMTLGMGLMIMLSYTSIIVEQEVFPLIAALGTGCLFQAPLIALQAAMPIKDMATASSGFMFVRTVGGAVGISLGEAIIGNVLPKKLADIPNFASLGLGTTTAELNDSIRLVHLIPDATLRDAVLHAWSQAIGTMWIMCTLSRWVFIDLVTFLARVLIGSQSRTDR